VDVKDPAVAVGLVSDKKAHVINAAYTAAEVATRLIKAGDSDVVDGDGSDDDYNDDGNNNNNGSDCDDDGDDSDDVVMIMIV